MGFSPIKVEVQTDTAKLVAEVKAKHSKKRSLDFNESFLTKLQINALKNEIMISRGMKPLTVTERKQME